MSTAFRLVLMVIVASVLHVGAIAGQSTQRNTAATTPVPAGDSTVRGRVADRQSNQPLAGALVHLFSADLRQLSVAKTDLTGHYRFETIAAGAYRIVVTHQGYLDQAYGVPDAQMARVSPEALVSVDRHSAARVDFAMVRTATVSGRVSSEGGQPLTGVTVTLTMMTGRGIRVSGRWNTTTTDTGEYVLTNVPEGNFQVSVVWEHARAAGGSRRAREVFYPGTDIADLAGVIEIAAADTLRNIDIVVATSHLLRIEGTFLRSSGSGPIEAYLLDGVSPLDIPVSADGRFSTPVLSAGRYTVVARTGPAAAREATWYTVDLSSQLSNLTLGLMPTGAIAGRVMTDDGTPAPATARIAAVLADQGKDIDLLLRDTVAIAADGTFELRGLFGERVLRIVGDTQGWAVARVIVDRTAVASVVVPSGSRIDDIRIIVTRSPP